MCYKFPCRWGVAQLVARGTLDPEVPGSMPGAPAIFLLHPQKFLGIFQLTASFPLRAQDFLQASQLGSLTHDSIKRKTASPFGLAAGSAVGKQGAGAISLHH